MVDVLTPEQRRKNMSRIRSVNTKPELGARRLIHAMGYRYRLHVRDLPGTPDIVFRSRRKVIFVNGCFWHMHACRFGQVRPATNSAFWEEKRRRTVLRDAIKRSALEELGWSVLTVWECELKDPESLKEEIRSFLNASGHSSDDADN